MARYLLHAVLHAGGSEPGAEQDRARGGRSAVACLHQRRPRLPGRDGRLRAGRDRVDPGPSWPAGPCARRRCPRRCRDGPGGHTGGTAGRGGGAGSGELCRRGDGAARGGNGQIGAAPRAHRPLVAAGPGMAGRSAGGRDHHVEHPGPGRAGFLFRPLPAAARLAVLVPIAVLARVAIADWISAVIIAVTLPLIPVFAVLVGWHTKAQTQAAVAAAGHPRRALPRRGRGLAHAQGVRPRQSAGRRDRQGHQ